MSTLAVQYSTYILWSSSARCGSYVKCCYSLFCFSSNTNSSIFLSIKNVVLKNEINCLYVLIYVGSFNLKMGIWELEEFVNNIDGMCCRGAGLLALLMHSQHYHSILAAGETKTLKISRLIYIYDRWLIYFDMLRLVKAS